jgi:hypothetical protein
MTRRRILAAAGIVAATAAFAACGADDATRPLVKPAAVPTGIVPDTVAGDLTLHEFAPARATFARAGETSLVADGRVWAIRRGETLVGTLQVSTVKSDVSVTDREDRAALIGGVMTGISYETIDVGSTQVIASTAADKSLYMWFGPNFFQVRQVKSTKVDPDTVAADPIEYQQATGKLGSAAPGAKKP